MEYAGASHVAYVGEHAYDAPQVVAVKRAEISYVEPLEYVLLLAQEALERIVEAENAAPVVLVDEVHAVEAPVDVVAEGVVALRGVEPGEI